MGVIDWGIGISTEDTKVIFQPFVTLKAARDIYAAGAGLGLYICKCLCKELNGSIQVINNIDEDLGKTAFMIEISVEEA